jgi:hypothetical protein
MGNLNTVICRTGIDALARSENHVGSRVLLPNEMARDRQRVTRNRSRNQLGVRKLLAVFPGGL